MLKMEQHNNDFDELKRKIATLELKLTKITGRQPLKKKYDCKANINSTNKWAYY